MREMRQSLAADIGKLEKQVLAGRIRIAFANAGQTQKQEVLTYDRIQLRNYIASLMRRYNEKTMMEPTPSELEDALRDPRLKNKKKKQPRRGTRDPAYLRSFLDTS
jgi:hypothetical protein